MEGLSAARWHSERGGIVLSWLTKLVVFLALGGVVLFDAISIGVTTSNVADSGSFAAHEASATWLGGHDLQQAYETATVTAREANSLNVIDPKTFTVDPDGTVHLTISRTATTLVLYRIGPIKKWADVSSRSQGRTVG
ncbi:MAG: hypothetical protein ABJA93_05515 [Sporichthyaceae bacterium]